MIPVTIACRTAGLWYSAVMIRTHVISCKLPRTRADALNLESGRVYFYCIFRFLAGSSMAVICYANDSCKALLVRCAATSGCCGDKAKPEVWFPSEHQSVR